MNQLLENIVRLIKNHPQVENVTDSDEHIISTAAFPAAEETEMLHPGRRRIKENYTSHWDLDYLPMAEVDKILEEIQRDKV